MSESLVVMLLKQVPTGVSLAPDEAKAGDYDNSDDSNDRQARVKRRNEWQRAIMRELLDRLKR